MSYLLDAGTVACLLQGNPITVLKLRFTTPAQVALPAPALVELDAAIDRVRPASRRASMRDAVDRLAQFVGVVPLSGVAARRVMRLRRRPRFVLDRLSVADVENIAIAQSLQRVLVSPRALAFREIPGLAVESWL